MASTRRQTLLSTSRAFCAALLAPPPPAELLATYFASQPQITEHGPAWANERLPFLGRTFMGTDECISYFTYLSDILEMKLGEDAFPGEDGFVVDTGADGGKGMVSVKGKGRFASKKTGKGWDEEFIYRLSGFDDDGKIGWWEIWADPLSAYVAVSGE